MKKEATFKELHIDLQLMVEGLFWSYLISGGPMDQKWLSGLSKTTHIPIKKLSHFFSSKKCLWKKKVIEEKLLSGNFDNEFAKLDVAGKHKLIVSTLQKSRKLNPDVIKMQFLASVSFKVAHEMPLSFPQGSIRSDEQRQVDNLNHMLQRSKSSHFN